MKFNNDEDRQNNYNMNKAQHEFAQSDVNGRLSRDKHIHSSNYDSGQPKMESNTNVYVPFNRRKSYSSRLFFGDVTKPWSPENTAGWLASDMTDPYNPNNRNPEIMHSPTKVTHHKHIWKHLCIALICVLVLFTGWCLWTNHNANQQSTQPQTPRVIKKTVINRQPNQNAQSQGNNNLQTLQQHAQQLQAEMQNLKLTSQEQQELLHLYQSQNANIQSEMYTWASRLGNMQFVPNNMKRSAVIWALHHYSQNN